MSAKHTPGPWKVSVGASNFGSEGCYGTIDDESGTHIADIWEDGRWKYADQDEPAANARLIAAAPDQHEVHQINIVDLVLLRKAIQQNKSKGDLLIRVDEILNRSRTIIAKATGDKQCKPSGSD